MGYTGYGIVEKRDMSKEIRYNTNGLKIQSKNGEFIDFAGISTMGQKQLYQVEFEDGTCIEVTDKHGFFTTDGRDIHTRELSIGLELQGTSEKIVKSITATRVAQTYDIIESTNHTYVANGVLCHNCIFLSSDALLINSLFLTNLSNIVEQIKPIKNIKSVTFWDDIASGETYLVGVDPATGNGEDFSVITIFHFPTMVQVAEYRSNTMSTNDLYGILKNILIYLDQYQTTVYFSIENNGVGEGIISLYEADENPSKAAEFVSEDGKDKRGMTTTSKTKMRACINLKEMLEKNNLHIKSRLLLAELKSYVRTKGAYAAQSGATDDIISSVLIIIRLVEMIASYDQTAFDKLYTANYDEWSQEDYDGYDGEYDDNDQGLPVLI